MAEIKPGWGRVRLGDVVDVITDYWDRDLSQPERFVAGEHIDEGLLRISRWGMTNDDLVPPTFNRRFRAGDVLFHSRNLRKLAQPNFGGITGEKIFVLRTQDPQVLIQELLPFLLQAQAFSAYTERMWAGSTNKFLNKGPLVKYEFALPPLEEQRRITQLLKAMSKAWCRLDYLAGCARIAFHSLIEHLYRHAALKWGDMPLTDLVKPDRPICYGILMPGPTQASGIPVVKVKDYPSGVIDEHGLLLTTPEIAASYKRSELKANDILVSIRGTIGRIALVPDSLDGANITQDSARLSFGREILPEFARAMLESASMQQKLRSNIPPQVPAGFSQAKAKPRDTIQGLNIGELRRVSMPLPPLDFQVEAVHAVLTARSAMIDAAARARRMCEIRAAAIATSMH